MQTRPGDGCSVSSLHVRLYCPFAQPPLRWAATSTGEPVSILQRFQQRRRLRQVAAQIGQARRTGEGLRLQEWEHSSDVLCSAGADAVIDAVLEWCRQTLSGCRRPWGIDYFDLAVAFRLDGRSQPKSLSFRRLRPTDLYGIGTLRHELAELLCQIAARSPQGPSERFHIAAALFSWGNAADAVLTQA
jgi:hypothetical protein